MQHESARTAIGLILQGSGFDRRSVAAVLLGALDDEKLLKKKAIEASWQALQCLPADSAEAEHLPETGQLPENEVDLADQLLPVVIDHPQQIGRQMTRLWTLCELWPHATWDERKHLRTAWLNSTCSCMGPEGSFLTRDQLRVWQREMPTLAGAENCSSAELGALVEADSARQAHYAVSSYLGSGADLNRLARVLSTLCSRLLLHRFDEKARIVDALCGCIAVSELHHTNNLASLAIAVGQLAHGIWWCAKDPASKPLRPGTEQDIDLIDAVRQGDMTAASRKARTTCLFGQAFWQPISDLLIELLEDGKTIWMPAVACTLGMLRRQQHQEDSINPDQAAAIAATFAAVYHLAHRGSQPFQRD